MAQFKTTHIDVKQIGVNSVVSIPSEAAAFNYASRKAIVNAIVENSAGVKIVAVYTFNGVSLKFRLDQLSPWSEGVDE